jgi:hypothetical protein
MNSPSPCSGMDYFSYLCTYDLYAPCVMFLMRADPLRGQVGGPNPLQLAQVLDLHASKIMDV